MAKSSALINKQILQHFQLSNMLQQPEAIELSRLHNQLGDILKKSKGYENEEYRLHMFYNLLNRILRLMARVSPPTEEQPPPHHAQMPPATPVSGRRSPDEIFDNEEDSTPFVQAKALDFGDDTPSETLRQPKPTVPQTEKPTTHKYDDDYEDDDDYEEEDKSKRAPKTDPLPPPAIRKPTPEKEKAFRNLLANATKSRYATIRFRPIYKLITALNIHDGDVKYKLDKKEPSKSEIIVRGTAFPIKELDMLAHKIAKPKTEDFITPDEEEILKRLSHIFSEKGILQHYVPGTFPLIEKQIAQQPHSSTTRLQTKQKIQNAPIDKNSPIVAGKGLKRKLNPGKVHMDRWIRHVTR